VTIVIDASVALAWCFPEETTADSDRLLDIVAQDGAVAPAHWRLEVANILVLALAKGRIAQDRADASLRLLGGLQIAIDPETGDRAWTESWSLAQKHKLTIYDAAYLELAQRAGARLATFDGELRAAAKKSGVPLA
jgi:predicted nucleic acid-binding protein